MVEFLINDLLFGVPGRCVCGGVPRHVRVHRCRAGHVSARDGGHHVAVRRASLRQQHLRHDGHLRESRHQVDVEDVYARLSHCELQIYISRLFTV